MNINPHAESRLLRELSANAYRDIKNGMDAAKREGMEKGIAIGTEKGIAIGTEKGIAIGTEKGIAIGTEKGIAIGTEKGIAIGTEKGAQAKALEVARKMKARGLEDGLISEMTGLPVVEIRKL